MAKFDLAHSSMKSDRLKIGDGLLGASRFPPLGRKRPGILYPAFASILQGDHGGVEYACQSHAGLLSSYGLLMRDNRLVANRPYRGSSLLEGLKLSTIFSR